MKKALYLILAVLPLTVTPLQAQDINQAKTLVEQAQMLCSVILNRLLTMRHKLPLYFPKTSLMRFVHKP